MGNPPNKERISKLKEPACCRSRTFTRSAGRLWRAQGLFFFPLLLLVLGRPLGRATVHVQRPSSRSSSRICSISSSRQQQQQQQHQAATAAAQAPAAAAVPGSSMKQQQNSQHPSSRSNAAAVAAPQPQQLHSRSTQSSSKKQQQATAHSRNRNLSKVEAHTVCR